MSIEGQRVANAERDQQKETKNKKLDTDDCDGGAEDETSPTPTMTTGVAAMVVISRRAPAGRAHGIVFASRCVGCAFSQYKVHV